MALVLSYSLVFIALALSYKEKLGLGKDIVVSTVRAAVQLTIMGLVLKFIFHLDNLWLTTLVLLFMVYNAASVAAKRGAGVANAKLISFGAIACGLFITLGSLLLFQALAYQPNQVIPVSGMIVSNSMVGLGLLYRNMTSGFQTKREEIEVKLCLGASPKQAAHYLVRDSIKTAMLPTFDSLKTLGIVQLPGMMTGLILAGTSPEVAIQYQIIISFAFAGNVTITTLIASYWAYRGFFTELAQLREM